MTLPSPQTRFFGRDADLARLRQLFRAGAGLVTLWGPPGIGKTRLAIELCRRDQLERAGQPIVEVWFCDLSTARTADEVEAAVTPVLAARQRGPGLLVLDNFEQVAEHARTTVGMWAQAAPELAILVTSRERLRLGHEVIHEVEPLADEAVQLFLDRAQQAAPARRAPLDGARVAELVAGLEGIPLAIELAAARLDLLGLDGLLARLGRPLELLAPAARDAPAHHATLERAIDRSYRLLRPVGQHALAQCAVFVAGFTVEAAEAVLELGAGARVLDVLQALRDRSLLRRVDAGATPRFALHAMVRAFAALALGDGDDAAALRARHARYYLGAAATLAPVEHENLAAAIAQLQPSRTSDMLVELHGRALAVAAVAASVRARGHRARGQALQLRGRLPEARMELERALELAEAEPELAGAIWMDLGVLYHERRDMAHARAAYLTALERLGPHADTAALARGKGNLGAVHHDLGQLDQAQAHYQEALAGFRAAGERRSEGLFLTNLGVLEQERGKHAPARRSYLEALEQLTGVGDRRVEAITHTNLGLLWQELGEPAQACACHERALAAFDEVIDPRSTGLCLGRLALALAALGRVDDARRECQRARERLERLDDRVALSVVGLFGALVELSANAPGARHAARAQVIDARSPGFADAAALCDLSDDARAALRLIEASLAAHDASVRLILRVGPDARWFASADAEPEDLSNRRVLRRLLLRLLDQHRAAPGQGLPLDALRDAGWPGERLVRSAAVNRVHVALSQLRQLGLRPFLVCRDGGYLIDPGVHVEQLDSPQT